MNNLRTGQGFLSKSWEFTTVLTRDSGSAVASGHLHEVAAVMAGIRDRRIARLSPATCGTALHIVTWASVHLGVRRRRWFGQMGQAAKRNGPSRSACGRRALVARATQLRQENGRGWHGVCYSGKYRRRTLSFGEKRRRDCLLCRQNCCSREHRSYRGLRGRTGVQAKVILPKVGEV